MSREDWNFKDTKCAVENCEDRALTRGLCKKHYQRQLRTGFVDGRKRKKGCSITDCKNVHHAKGYCQTHYRRLKNDPDFGKMTHSTTVTTHSTTPEVIKEKIYTPKRLELGSIMTVLRIEDTSVRRTSSKGYKYTTKHEAIVKGIAKDVTRMRSRISKTRTHSNHPKYKDRMVGIWTDVDKVFDNLHKAIKFDELHVQDKSKEEMLEWVDRYWMQAESLFNNECENHYRRHG